MKISNDINTLGTRMKDYEAVTNYRLLRKVPVIIRIDGKAFHTFTKGMDKPFDNILMKTMWETTKYLCKNLQGCKLGYTQSDEISLLLTDYQTKTTDACFKYKVRKLSSIPASMATMQFNKIFRELVLKRTEKGFDTKEEAIKFKNIYYRKFDSAIFDARPVNYPKEEVNNYFLWRQQDCTRNSIECMAQAHFSHKQLLNLSCSQLQEKLFQEKNINWNNIPVSQKRGICVIRTKRNKEVIYNNKKIICTRNEWIIDENIPIFSQDINYVEKYL